jgi:hypothetical protein
MGSRAKPSGIKLNAEDARIVKGMLERGDRQHDIASYFGVNGGRVAEISTGEEFPDVETASLDELPPPGPYLSGREVAQVLSSLAAARAALAAAEATVHSALK